MVGLLRGLLVWGLGGWFRSEGGCDESGRSGGFVEESCLCVREGEWDWLVGWEGGGDGRGEESWAC